MTAAGSAFRTPRQRTVFGLLLLIAMGVATYPAAVLSILATFLIDEFSITRAQVGLVATVNVAVSAMLSPLVGRITDRVGGKRALVFIFVLGAAGFLALSVSPGYGALLLAALPAGLSQAAGNPATNKLIALHTPAGRRGVVTGFKQSGVQAAIFAGGLLVPWGAITVGWRWTLVVLAALTASVVPIVWRVVPPDQPLGEESERRPSSPLSPMIKDMAIYGFLLGLGGSVTFFVPLFVEEALGGSPALGGLAVGLTGLTAFFGRIGWARYAETSQRFAGPLAVIAIGSVAASATFLMAQTAGLWLVWVAAALAGLTLSSWNSVGMLGVITLSDATQAGRASGMVLMGFLAGLGIGPPMFGWIVDATRSYTAVWVVSMGVFALALFPMRVWTLRNAATSH